MTPLSIGIAGAGLLGRLLAFRLSRAGHRVDVFDCAAGPLPTFDGRQAAGLTAAGMLSPLAELDCSPPEVAELGWRSIALWRETVGALAGAPAFAQRGSLLLAHRSDLGSAQRVLARLTRAAPDTPQPRPLAPSELTELEPALHGAPHAWLLPHEGHIDPVATLAALHAEAGGARWHWGAQVTEVQPGTLVIGEGPARRFDVAFDVRGVGARPAMPVRGVRGELVWLQSTGHGLTRPVRLLHPRHRVYLVPRSPDLVLVGASEIESEDCSPVSLRSAVELMSAAHSVMPGLAEARILRLDANLRPALPDNAPRVEVVPGRVSINGLFRHGWLLAPALVEDALARAGLEARAARAVVPA